jgi:hypothetical protein
MDLPLAPPRSVRLAAVVLWFRAVLHLLALVFGLLADYLQKTSDEWFSALWWYLQEPTGWLVSGLGALGIETYPWPKLMGAGFVTVSVLYAVVGVRVWRAGRVACRLATVLMVLSAVLSTFMLYGSVDTVARGDGSIAPFGHNPTGDRLSVPTLLLWPLMLLGSAIAVAVLINMSAVRRYRVTSDRAESAALLAWKDSRPSHPPGP